MPRTYAKEEAVEMSVVVAYQETAVGNLALKEAAKDANLRETSMTVVNVPEAVDIDVIERTRCASTTSSRCCGEKATGTTSRP
jgi:hypothetical protein